MLHGTFGNADGSLRLEGNLILPQLGFQQQTTFVVDTGATSSCVHPRVIRTRGVDMQGVLALPSYEISGIGGDITVFEAQGILAFQDANIVHLYETTIAIFDPDDPPDIPSIVGRDILERWRMVYARAQGILEFEVLESDYTWSVTL